MKKMISLAAFAIMMAMGNMNAFANKNGAKHNEYHNDKGRMEMRFDGRHLDSHGHKMSDRERRMIEERRRMEEHRRMEERRRMEEARRHHVAHTREVHAVSGNVVAGVAVGAAVAALVSALIK